MSLLRKSPTPIHHILREPRLLLLSMRLRWAVRIIYLPLELILMHILPFHQDFKSLIMKCLPSMWNPSKKHLESNKIDLSSIDSSNFSSTNEKVDSAPGFRLISTPIFLIPSCIEGGGIQHPMDLVNVLRIPQLLVLKILLRLSQFIEQMILLRLWIQLKTF